ncbi:YggT family protein [Comamonas sp. NoAH]|uniref:YggT family protein n=1 Tax=Comamonas halotolerans TaxID=3041496 RepID=UPI0024E12AB2|nr:YggT family protein [Comamonas sp. NoAH]
MIVQILQFLLEVACGLVAGASLLRLYMQVQRIPFNNPIGKLVFALSDWLVMPLRKVIPNRSRYDLSSLAAALLVVFVQYVLMWLLRGAVGSFLLIPLVAVFGLLRMALTGMMGILIVYAILTWVQPHSPLVSILHRLSEPVLRPLRKVIPLVGGIDLSALAAIVLIQVLMMVLANVQFGLLAGATGIPVVLR